MLSKLSPRVTKINESVVRCFGGGKSSSHNLNRVKHCKSHPSLCLDALCEPVTQQSEALEPQPPVEKSLSTTAL